MTRDVVSEVRDRADIVEIVGQQVQLKKAGRNFKGLCPFHQEKTPSFIVFPDSQNFHCFGCGKGGDAFTYLMLTENIDFREALTELSEKVGVPLESTAPTKSEPDPRRQKMLELCNSAALFYSNILHESTRGEPGRAFVRDRGIDEQTVRKFRLGYAPEGWDNLTAYLTNRGADLEMAAEIGLLQTRDSGGYYDRFRHRALFPICDRNGDVVGFGGRAFGDEQPKYLNSPQSPIFDKSRLLYGLDLARDAIRDEDAVVIVEGYMDVITAHQFEYANVVGAMGTSVTETQVDLLKRMTKRIVIALDADAAGELAAMRSIDSLHSSLQTSETIVPDPRTMFRIGKRLDAEIKIAELPTGADPDDTIRADPAQWRTLIEDATPYVAFLIDRTARSIDPNDAAAKRQAVDRLTPVLQLIPDEIEQSHYIQRLSRRLDLDYRSLQVRIRRPTSRPAVASPDVDLSREQSTRKPTREAHLLSLYVQHPAVCAEEIQSTPIELLEDTRNRVLLGRLKDAVPVDQWANPGPLEVSDDQLLQEQVEWLLSLRMDHQNQLPGQIREDVWQLRSRLERERHDRLVRHLQSEIAKAQEDGDQEALDRLATQRKELAEEQRRFDPRPSPYFRDLRDKDLMPAATLRIK
jgi:DNA primase